MKTLLYFGSFNPIHLGHIRLAVYALQHTDAEQLWFVVSPNNPLKDKHTLYDQQLRLQMVKLAIQDAEMQFPDCKGKLFASDIEFDMPLPSYTVNTLNRLTHLYPNNTFSLLIGSDNLSCFDKWKDYEQILQKLHIVVYPRRGDDINSLLNIYPKVEILSGAPMFDISSTYIRVKLKSGELTTEWLSPSVAALVKTQMK